MTKEKAIKLFLDFNYCGGTLRDAVKKEGKVTVRCLWCDFTDFLCKNGDITEKQYNTWTLPGWIYE